jgi:hypothetical protein
VSTPMLMIQLGGLTQPLVAGETPAAEATAHAINTMGELQGQALTAQATKGELQGQAVTADMERAVVTWSDDDRDDELIGTICFLRPVCAHHLHTYCMYICHASAQTTPVAPVRTCAMQLHRVAHHTLC